MTLHLELYTWHQEHKKQKCWPSTHAPTGNLFLTKEDRIYNTAKIVSSLSDVGKTGQLHAKEWNKNTS